MKTNVKVGRNEPCPCGKRKPDGKPKKFKHCCEAAVKAGKKTMAELEKAALTAKSFDDLLGTLPATERNKVLNIIRNPETWEGLVNTAAKTWPKQIRGGLVAGSIGAQKDYGRINALAPQEQPQQNQNALAR